MPPRQLLAKNERHSNESLDTSGPGKSAAKRKAVSSACIPCRRRKSKCDGGTPSCSTCIAVYRTECSYDPDVDQRRKPLPRKDAQSTSPAQGSSSDVIVNTLRRLSEAEAITLLRSIRSEEKLDDVATSLSRDHSRLTSPIFDHREPSNFGSGRASISGSSTFQSESRPPLSQPVSSTSSSERTLSEQQALISPTSFGPWFRSTQDADFIEHLFNLYFSWHHPMFPVFSKPHFLKDYQGGRARYCSAVLLNAVLSLACNYSDRVASQTETPQPDRPGDVYFAEAKSLLNASEEPSLTACQALGIMGMRETSCGRSKSGYAYIGRAIRMAMTMNLHLQPQPSAESGIRQVDIEIAKLTFWQLHNMEMMQALYMGKVSQIPLNTISVEKPANADKLDSIIWQAYEDVNLPISPNAKHAMHCLLFTKVFSELSQLLNEFNLSMYAPQERMSIRKLQLAHTRYQDWYHRLPDVFHLQNTGMPHVIVMHMYYYHCLLQLFRPFMKIDLSTANLYPRTICTYCANEITSLMNALRGMYGLRRVCLAAVGAIAAAGTMHLQNLPEPTASANLTQTLHDLWSLSVNHGYGLRAIKTIKSLAVRYSVTLPEAASFVHSIHIPDSPAHSPTSSTFPSLNDEPLEHMIFASSSDSIQQSDYRERLDSGFYTQPAYSGYQQDDLSAPQTPSQTQSSLWYGPGNQGMMMPPPSDYPMSDAPPGHYQYPPQP